VRRQNNLVQGRDDIGTEFPDDLGTPLAKGDVVFGGAPLVTMAFDGDVSGGMIPEEIR
jgi:hypothetical protein